MWTEGFFTEHFVSGWWGIYFNVRDPVLVYGFWEDHRWPKSSNKRFLFCLTVYTRWSHSCAFHVIYVKRRENRSPNMITYNWWSHTCAFDVICSGKKGEYIYIKLGGFTARTPSSNITYTWWSHTCAFHVICSAMGEYI